MQRNRTKLVLYGLLTLAVMVLIFVMSAQDATRSDETSGWLLNTAFGQTLMRVLPALTGQGEEHDIRKYAHMTEYAALAISGCLFFRELLAERRPRLSPLCALGLSFLYACTDEWHQRFVPGRSGKFSDVLIDCGGALLGLLALAILLFLIDRGRSRRARRTDR